ncbi:MAG: hypothetical protein IKF16_10190 [Lachnospiraceae bacterium]|nr:hypothetical protein [Lachnospiraceae bacterium]
MTDTDELTYAEEWLQKAYDSAATDGERLAVMQAYHGEDILKECAWTQQVMKMTPEEVHEIYLSIVFRKDIEAKAEAKKHKKIVPPV